MLRARYVCYNKTRHPGKCNGQTGYTVKKLDDIIENIAHKLFEQITDVPKDTLVEEQYNSVIGEYKKQLSAAQSALSNQTKEVNEYEAEVLKVIRGESSFDADLITKLHNEAREKASNSENEVQELKAKIYDNKVLMESFSKQYDDLVTWADMFSECDIETKKMILSRIMSDVRVSRYYEIEITFTMEIEQFGGATQPEPFLENGVKILPRMACAG